MCRGYCRWNRARVGNPLSRSSSEVPPRPGGTNLWQIVTSFTRRVGYQISSSPREIAAIIERAVASGLTEVLVMRFPNSLCTDRGRAINQQETGWETTLTGLPKELYDFWDRQLRPLGYKLKVQIIDFPDGMPGDVGMSLKWV